MGNSGSAPGPQGGAPQNTQSQNPTQNSSAFTPKQRSALLKRYQSYDNSKDGTVGIPLDVCLAMPEFAGNNLISVLIHDYLDTQTGRMHPQGFLQFCSFLGTGTSAYDKKRILFDSFNVYGTENFTHDELFRLYKVLLGHVISDDHILALTFEALKHPGLQKQGQLTKDDFLRLVPDSEIDQKLTVRFNLPAG